MDRDILFKFISESGVRTKVEIYEKFPDENLEIVDMTIDSLSAKNMIRRSKYDSPEGISELYFIPHGSNA